MPRDSAISFPVCLDALAAPGVVRAMTPPERGVFLALCEEAWGRGCALPADRAFLATVGGCTAAGVERVERASRGAMRTDGRVVRFGVLAALRQELMANAARVSELQRRRRMGRTAADGEGAGGAGGAKSLRLVSARTAPEPPLTDGPPTGGAPAVNRRSTGGGLLRSS